MNEGIDLEKKINIMFIPKTYYHNSDPKVDSNYVLALNILIIVFIQSYICNLYRSFFSNL